MKKIVFKIGKDGGMTVEGEGFTGEACLESSKRFIDALGQAQEEEKKPEFYMNEQAGVQINN